MVPTRAATEVVIPAARPAIRPSGWWYVAAWGVFVVGLVVGGFTAVRAWDDAQEVGFDTSLANPGQDQQLTITETGGYTVAYGGPQVVSNEMEKDELTRELSVTITPDAGGAPLILRPYDGFQDLTGDEGQQYVPLQTVRFTEPGDYTLRSAPVSRLDRNRSALLVSESPFRKLREGLERAVAIVVVSFLLAVLASVILGVTRARAKRAARSATGPPSWPPGYGPPTGYGPPGWR